MEFYINSSIDITDEEVRSLRDYFPDEEIQIKPSIFSPGVDSTYLILSFVFSSIAGGVLYDLVKFGIVKLFKRTKRNIDRPVIITIKQDDKIYRLKDEEVSRMEENGIYINLKDIDQMFKELETK